MDRFSSNFRGLEESAGSIGLADFSIIIGPNNGGKTQYLRSLVLLSELKARFPQIIQSFERIYGNVDGFQRLQETLGFPLVQSLVDLDFGDLADEIAQSLEAHSTLGLTFSLKCKNFGDLHQFWAHFLDGSHDIYRYNQQSFELFEKEKKNEGEEFWVDVKFKISHDAVRHELFWTSMEILGLPGAQKIKIDFTKKLRDLDSEGYVGFRYANSEFETSIYSGGRKIGKEKFMESSIRPCSIFFKKKSRMEIDRLNWIEFKEILIAKLFGKIPSGSYIGSVRIVDGKDYRVGYRRSKDVIGRRGENTWLRLNGLGPIGTRFVNNWLPKITGVSEIWGQRDTTTKPNVIGLMGKQTLPISAFGLGTSQVLPILVEMAHQLEEIERGFPHDEWREPAFDEIDTLIVEEPESHLHPDSQKELAMSMVEFCNRGGRVIIETHSEIFVKVVELMKIKAPSLTASVAWVDFRNSSEPNVQSFEITADDHYSLDLPSSFDEVVPNLIDEKWGQVSNASNP